MPFPLCKAKIINNGKSYHCCWTCSVSHDTNMFVESGMGILATTWILYRWQRFLIIFELAGCLPAEHQSLFGAVLVYHAQWSRDSCNNHFHTSIVHIWYSSDRISVNAASTCTAHLIERFWKRSLQIVNVTFVVYDFGDYSWQQFRVCTCAVDHFV